jgi:hypothetical protein
VAGWVELDGGVCRGSRQGRELLLRWLVRVSRERCRLNCWKAELETGMRSCGECLPPIATPTPTKKPVLSSEVADMPSAAEDGIEVASV